MNIYVGNLLYSIGEEDLREFFEDYGEVESVKLIIDKLFWIDHFAFYSKNKVK